MKRRRCQKYLIVNKLGEIAQVALSCTGLKIFLLLSFVYDQFLFKFSQKFLSKVRPNTTIIKLFADQSEVSALPAG